LFQGGESNVRQRIYGARTVHRLLGVWPRTFWEEEFDFFPQLPQILAGAGYQYASLFFQWTWHTPYLPLEQAPAIWWEAMDGARLLTAPRNDLNLHQWPEEFAGLLENPSLHSRPLPLILQWLELMPSPDWMCRSELILPQMKALLDNPTLDLRFVTLPEFLETAREMAEPRRYTLDDVFHGTSLGKNGDLFRRLSRMAEQSALAAESFSALGGFLGRPYPNWDVYPTWELEEAWRELLSAQHHDNEECEGLCGYVGERSFERSMSLSGGVTDRTLNLIARRTRGSADRLVVFNPLGWERSPILSDPLSGKQLRIDPIPAFGYRVVEPEAHFAFSSQTRVTQDASQITIERGQISVTVDRSRGAIYQIRSANFPEGALPEGAFLADLSFTRQNQVDRFTGAQVSLQGEADQPAIQIVRLGRDGARVVTTIRLAPDLEAVDIHYQAENLPRPDPRLAAALQTTLTANLKDLTLTHDHPYGVSDIRAQGSYLRKYPTGDWMTSPQVFETIENPFTALQFLDLHDEERGLLCLHDGSQAYLRRNGSVIQILSMYDAWDEDYFVNSLEARVRIVPHGVLSNGQRWRLAQEFTRPVLRVSCGQKIKHLPPLCAGPGGELPEVFGGPTCEAPNVVITAFYREMEEAGRDLGAYAGQGLAYPYILRLVELDGKETLARVRVPGRTAAIFLTDLLGRPARAIPGEFHPAQDRYAEFTWLELPLHPFEIATLYLDLVMGRKEYRDLDSDRKIWATAHKVEEK
jgi:alpha-mannosidase